MVPEAHLYIDFMANLLRFTHIISSALTVSTDPIRGGG